MSVHDPRTDAFSHQVKLNASLQVAIDEAARKATERTTETFVRELRKISEDFFNPSVKPFWITIPPSGGANPNSVNVSAQMEGRWNLYKILLLSTDGTHYPAQVTVSGINGAELVYLNSTDKLLEMNFTVWDIQNLVITNTDTTYHARVILEFKKAFRTPYQDDQL